MTETDVALWGGYLLAAFAFGFGCGSIVRAARVFAEKI